MRCDSYACLDALAKKENLACFRNVKASVRETVPVHTVMTDTIPEKPLINQKPDTIVSVSLL